MTATARLLKLLGLLEIRRDWTAEELAARLEVTTRTVRRDIAKLRDLGYPVDAMSGPGGGYHLGSGASVPPLVLDDDEAVALAISLRIAMREDVAGVDEAGLTLLAKLERMLPPRLRSRLEDVTATTIALASPPGPRIESGTLAVLAQAARAMERVRFVYTPSGRDPAERHVEPYRVVLAHRRWYLVAFDRDRDAWRTFRLDRIANPVATGMHFTRADPPDPAAQVEEGMALAPYSMRGTVVLGAPIEEARRFVSGTVGRLEERPDGTTMLTIGADDPAWIARYVAGLPVPFHAVEPPELVEAVRTLASRLLEGHPG